MARKQSRKGARAAGRRTDGPLVDGPDTHTGWTGNDTRVQAGEAREDRVTGAIEKQTARVPSIAFLELAAGAMGVSWFLKLKGQDGWANFIAQWVPSLLIVGVYNKMVKQHGSDASSDGREAAAHWETHGFEAERRAEL